MPSDRTRLALVAIRENALLAQTSVADLSEAPFPADPRAFYPVTRCLEIVSEAARRLAPETRERNKALPWRETMGVGNVYRHDYDNVAEELVWRTVRHDLDPLLDVVAREIALPPSEHDDQP